MIGNVSHVIARLCGFLTTFLFTGPLDAATLKIIPHGPEVVMFKWDPVTCGKNIIPDAPARAFVRADGKIYLYATTADNWFLLGQSFGELRTSCATSLRSSDYAEQRLGKVWLEATYTEDGRNIAGLASQDLRETLKDRGCEPSGNAPRCWLNNIIALWSSDMGETFAPLAPERRVIATLGQADHANNQSRFGYFTTSNIVGRGGFYYVFMYAQGEGVQEAGNCLFRTSTPLDPSSWRGWNGEDFTIVPRLEQGRVGACKPVAPKTLTHEVRSLSYVSKYKIWVAVSTNRLKLASDDKPIPGFYLSMSTDLLEWGAPSRIMESPTRARVDSPERVTNYPSIIDPDSRSRNFDTIDGPNPVLLYTVHHLKNGQGTMNRDLVYVPLRIEAHRN
jgi:hypothetical protein